MKYWWPSAILLGATWVKGVELPSNVVKIHPYRVSEFPSKQSDSVDYVIITTDELKPAFANFVQHKTEKGINTVARTVSWIDNNYPGCDLPERIRNFLKDAHNNWGAKYVLLGGDAPIVPIRYIRSTNHYQVYYCISTDMYYANLDGSWNANRNNVWGEVEVRSGSRITVPSDSTSYNTHLYVGRFPVTNSQEVEGVVTKTIAYEHGSLGSMEYKNKVLCIAGILYGGNADFSVDQCGKIASHFPDHFEKHLLHAILSCTMTVNPFGFLDNGSNLTKSAFFDSLKQGYSYVYVVVHGSPSQDWAPPCNVSRVDADTLRSPWFYMSVVSCYVNWVDVKSLSEQFILNQHGWVFSYRGSSRVGFDTQEHRLNDIFYHKLFSDPSGDSTTEIGKLDAYAKDKLKNFFLREDGDKDNNYRDTYMSCVLLGDPELRLWINTPGTMEVNLPRVVNIGEGGFTVTVKNSTSQPIQNARVCVSRKNELYARGFTDANGTISFTICSETSGALKVVVTKQNFLPYEGSIFIDPTRPFVRYKSHYTDKIVEAGSEVLLRLALENRGSTVAREVRALITSNSPFVTVHDSIQTYGDISPSTFTIKDYVIKVNKECPPQQVCFSVNCQFSGGASKDTFHLQIHAPILSHYTHSMSIDSLSPGVPINLSFKIKNAGTQKANKVKAKLSALSPIISVIDSTEEIGAIPAKKIGTYTNCFTIILNDNVGAPQFVLELEDSLARRWVDTFVVRPVPPPESLYILPGLHAITVGWKPIPGVYRYNVYRVPNLVPLNFDISWENPLFTDNGTNEFKRYSYWVTAVDNNLNESKFSSPIVGSPNPFFKPGWPRPGVSFEAYFNTTVAVCNIIPTTQELEIIANGDDGILYGWKYNGQGILRTDGVLAENLGRCWTSPAVADIDNNGSLEIIRVEGFTSNPRLFVSKNDGTLLPNFPVRLQGDWGAFSSPSVQDLDGDGRLEIIVIGFVSRNVYAFRADGSGFLSPDGIFAVMDSNVLAFTTAAIADINMDGTLEIITACRGCLYVWNQKGELLPNWPVQIVGYPSSPAVGDVDPTYHGLEIVIHTTGDSIYVFHHDGTVFWKKSCRAGGTAGRMSSPTIGDMDGDDLLEVALIGRDKLHLWNYDGSYVRNPAGTPVESLFIPTMMTVTRSSPIIGDVDGDNECEIIFTSLLQGDIYAIKKDGSLAHGFPIMANGLIDGTPTLADIDLDGNNELILTTATPDVRVWSILGQKVEWGTFAHDRWRTCLHGFTPKDTHPVLEDISPITCYLSQNTPNPFSQVTTIKYQIPYDSKATLKIYDIAGRLVRTLVDQEVAEGCHTISWRGEDNSGKRVARGIYFYKLQVERGGVTHSQIAKKLLIL